MSDQVLKLPDSIKSGEFLVVGSGENYSTKVVAGEKLLDEILTAIFGDQAGENDRAAWGAALYDLDQWIPDIDYGPVEWDFPVGETDRIRALRIIRESVTPQPSAAEEFLPRGARLIAAERQRQMEKLGWTAAHDDKHDGMELSAAAAGYVLDVFAPIPSVAHSMAQRLWPWSLYSFKRTPEDPVRQLVKAGALIAAEIDRLERAQLGGPKMAGESEVGK